MWRQIKNFEQEIHACLLCAYCTFTSDAANSGRKLPAVLVGSLNPTKLAATQTALEQVWPGTRWRVEGIVVPGTDKQRLTGGETQKGAHFRAKKAIEDHRQPLYGVGIDSGMFRVEGVWMECSWVIVRDRHGNTGIGTGPSTEVPEKYAIRMQMGESLDDICDRDFNRSEIGLYEGYIGLVTGNAVPRTQCYTIAVACAPAKYIQADLFRQRLAGS